MLQIYNKLLELPLFLGIDRADLAQIVDKTRFGFLKLEPNQTLVEENQKCQLLYFLMSGQMIAQTHSDNRRYSIIEQFHAPNIIQAEYFFGFSQRYTKTFTARTDCSLLSLDKNEVLRLASQHLIFQLNLLGTLATGSQRGSRILWHNEPTTLREQFVRFVVQRCMRPAGEKTINIRMKDLAAELHAPRLNISSLLNSLQADNLLTLSRGRIVIPALEKLIQE